MAEDRSRRVLERMRRKLFPVLNHRLVLEKLRKIGQLKLRGTGRELSEWEMGHRTS